MPLTLKRSMLLIFTSCHFSFPPFDLFTVLDGRSQLGGDIGDP